MLDRIEFLLRVGSPFIAKPGHRPFVDIPRCLLGGDHVSPPSISDFGGSFSGSNRLEGSLHLRPRGPLDYLGRIASGDAKRRDVLCDDAPRAYDRPFADGDTRENDCAGADPRALLYDDLIGRMLESHGWRCAVLNEPRVNDHASGR